jgi:hypothetical protein
MSESPPRRTRILSAHEKFQIWLQLLTGELPQAAERYGIDPTTILRIRRIAREGALAALASSKPGVAMTLTARSFRRRERRSRGWRRRSTSRRSSWCCCGAGSARAGRPDPGARQR